ncbi:hypothetical protein D3C81_1993410 [compost metagenome]
MPPPTSIHAKSGPIQLAYRPITMDSTSIASISQAMRCRRTALAWVKGRSFAAERSSRAKWRRNTRHNTSSATIAARPTQKCRNRCEPCMAAACASCTLSSSQLRS